MRATDIPKLMANIARDMSQVAAGAAAGKELVSSDRQARLETCRSNKCGFYSMPQGRCLHPDCGCFCAAKSWFNMLNCPLGFWKK